MKMKSGKYKLKIYKIREAAQASITEKELNALIEEGYSLIAVDKGLVFLEKYFYDDELPMAEQC